MQVIKEKDIDYGQIVDALKKGKTIVYPTETCYGLGCDATNADAVKKIFDIKKRQKEKTVLVIVPDLAMIKDQVVWSKYLQKVSDLYWPGPLTVVTGVVDNSLFPEGIVRVDGTIAFRVTNHPVAVKILEELGRPIVSTSANISESENPYSASDVEQMFAGADAKPDILIDGGDLPHKLPSTILKLEGSKASLIREGEMKVDVDQITI